MITTKRQIRTNDDRYIGSADDTIRANTAVAEDIRSGRAVDKTAPFADIRIPEEPVREAHEAYDTFRVAEKMPVIEQRSTVEKPLYSTRETVQTELPTRPVKETKPHGIEDVMPSLKTLNEAERRADVMPTEKTAAAERTVEQPRARTNLSPKMKVVMIVCLAVALVLAIAVIATGVSISHASAESAELAQAITEQQAVIAEQQATLAHLTSDSTLRDEAILHGMVPATDPEYTASRAEKSDYPEATPHSNGFDKFCDWLSGIIN